MIARHDCLPSCSVDENERIVSSGAGVERDVLWTAFQTYLDREAEWFHQRADGTATLGVMTSGALARYCPPERLLEATRLGAICALLMIHGIAPVPFSPALFQFFAHDGDIHALHREFVREWHPEVGKTIQDWIDMGEEGDPSPFNFFFASYLDRQVSGRLPQAGQRTDDHSLDRHHPPGDEAKRPTWPLLPRCSMQPSWVERTPTTLSGLPSEGDSGSRVRVGGTSSR